MLTLRGLKEESKAAGESKVAGNKGEVQVHAAEWSRAACNMHGEWATGSVLRRCMTSKAALSPPKAVPGLAAGVHPPRRLDHRANGQVAVLQWGAGKGGRASEFGAIIQECRLILTAGRREAGKQASKQAGKPASHPGRPGSRAC